MEYPVTPPPSRRHSRNALIERYFEVALPTEDIPAEVWLSGQDTLDLPSEAQMAWYLLNVHIGRLRTPGADVSYEIVGEAVLALGELVQDAEGAVLQRCAKVLGVDESLLSQALTKCPTWVEMLFGQGAEDSPAATRRRVAAAMGISEELLCDLALQCPQHVAERMGIVSDRPVARPLVTEVTDDDQLLVFLGPGTSTEHEAYEMGHMILQAKTPTATVVLPEGSAVVVRRGARVAQEGA